MNSKPSELDAFLNLPTDPQGSGSVDKNPDDEEKEEKTLNPAVELIRQKVEAAYAAEPDLAIETEEVKEAASSSKLTKHQKFVYDLTSSGKSLEEIQAEWHDYYAGLPDIERHQVWQEFYSAQAAIAHHPVSKEQAAIEASKPQSNQPPELEHAKSLQNISQTLSDVKQGMLRTLPRLPAPKRRSPFRSLGFGLTIGFFVIFIFLFSFFNERFIAPFIQPSRSLSNIPLIAAGTAAGPNPEIIIPKINVDIPVIYDEYSIDEAAVDKALENGVVNFGDSARPGQDGNVVIVGHSSNNIFNKGRYKFAFVLLSRLEPGDTFYLQKDGKRYTYQVYQKKIVKPSDVSVLGATDKTATASLVTCDPPGTSINRLVVTGEQISPNPSANAAKSTDNSQATQAKIIPGNSQSLWSRFWHWLSH